jgi:hypothetical protein
MPEAPDLPRRPEDDEEPGDWVDRFVLVFLRESMLWPILIVIVGHVVVFVAPVMLIAVRERRPSAIVMIGFVCWGSVSVLRFDRKRSGKFSQLSALVGVTWGVAIGVALGAHYSGIF